MDSDRSSRMSSSRGAADLAIRRLRIADAGQYLAFRASAIEQAPTAFTASAAEARRQAIGWALDRIENAQRPDDFVLGAHHQGELIGVAGFRRFEESQTRHKATLFGMAVAPARMGMGIGSRLIDVLLSQASNIEGMRQVVLTLSDENARAEGLYRSKGFRRFGLEPRAVLVGAQSVAKIHMVCMLDEHVGSDYRTA